MTKLPVKKVRQRKSSSKNVSNNYSLIKDVFIGAGFSYISSDNKHITVSEQTGEIDHIFMWKNVIILCEETTGRDISHHFPKKVMYHNLISNNKIDFFKQYEIQDNSIMQAIADHYEYEDLEVRHLYYSEEKEVPRGTARNGAALEVMTKKDAKYFESLTKIIGLSAKYELLKFLKISLANVGDARLSGKGVASHFLPAFALSAKRTNYPDNFILVSLYVDPQTLLSRACVLRRDGWEDPELSYQRFIDKKKLEEMRKYLAGDGKVFINNLIVTFPCNVILKDSNGNILKRENVEGNNKVEVELKDEIATIGIIDGQHRIFAYYEGEDDYEKQIKRLRTRQSLLVTGIIFPEGYTELERIKFEAGLFLSINSNQKQVDTSLQQDLGVIIHPEQPLSIARVIVQKLFKSGSLHNIFQTSPLISDNQVATGSLAPYVVEPIIKVGGDLYNLWNDSSDKDLNNEDHRNEYIEYCYEGINNFLNMVREVVTSKWKPEKAGGILNATTIGGFIHLYGLSLKGDITINKKTLSVLVSFDFKKYRSSRWAAMSNDIAVKLSA
ncbi:DGQHR domain-containing protein [Acetobacter syzygii]|uniref:DGQHR domain-containing protein n=1 Tax=Acetobacter syzygii TaxID=146476 RepID=UPI00156E1A1C|nr:DGQHR domain-containing protein [Acetobacter syzygii]NSL92943.1 DGQHR domain-containing protein [Acetobacter syzygii]